MGVDYSAVSGYGFVLSPEDYDFEELAKRVGFEYEYEFDSYEFIEYLCKRYEVYYALAGNSYSGDVYYLIGDATSVGTFGFVETKPLVFDTSEELHDRLVRMQDDLGIALTISYYSGVHIW